MFTQFPKKTLFSKLISGIVAVSFILTSVPIRSYANADKLRTSLAKTGGKSELINEMFAADSEEMPPVEDSTIFGPNVKAIFSKNEKTGIWTLEKFEVDGQEKSGTTRTFGDLEKLFSDQKAIQTFVKVNGNQVVAYWMMRNLLPQKLEGKAGEEQQKKAELIRQNKIRADVTLIPPSKIGNELIKTTGHYHPAIDDPHRADSKAVPGINSSFTEVYVVLEGEAIYYLQKIDKDGNVVDAVQIHAKKGDIVPIPSTYGHITINPSKDKALVMMNWVSDEFNSTYGDILNSKAGAYYFLQENDGRITAVKNPEYARQGKAVAEIRQGNVDEELAAAIGLLPGKPVYNVINLDRSEDLKKLADFLRNPESSSNPKFDKLLGRIPASPAPAPASAPVQAAPGLFQLPLTEIPFINLAAENVIKGGEDAKTIEQNTGRVLTIDQLKELEILTAILGHSATRNAFVSKEVETVEPLLKMLAKKQLTSNNINLADYEKQEKALKELIINVLNMVSIEYSKEKQAKLGIEIRVEPYVIAAAEKKAVEVIAEAKKAEKIVNFAEVIFDALVHFQAREIAAKEFDKMINKRILGQLSKGIKTITLCVGSENKGLPVEAEILAVKKQLDINLAGVSAETLLNTEILLAFEPTSKIGTGTAADPNYIRQVHQAIFDWLVVNYSKETALNVWGKSFLNLYGGSADDKSIKGIMLVKSTAPEMEGVQLVHGVLFATYGKLVSGFLKIANEVNEAAVRDNAKYVCFVNLKAFTDKDKTPLTPRKDYLNEIYAAINRSEINPARTKLYIAAAELGVWKEALNKIHADFVRIARIKAGASPNAAGPYDAGFPAIATFDDLDAANDLREGVGLYRPDINVPAESGRIIYAVLKSKIEHSGLVWDDVVNKLTSNGWAKRVKDAWGIERSDDLRLNPKWWLAKDAMAKEFNEANFAKLWPILLQSIHRRLIATAESLKERLDKGDKIALIFHQGRTGDPNFIKDPFEHAEILNYLVGGNRVKAVNDLLDKKAIKAIKGLKAGQCIVLKQVRANDPLTGKTLEESPWFAPTLRPLIKYFILGGLSVLHRDTNSITGLRGVPTFADRLMVNEIKAGLNERNPAKPHLEVIGGAKVEKLNAIIDQLNGNGKTDMILVGGVPAEVALVADQMEQGKDYNDDELLNLAKVVLGPSAAESLQRADDGQFFALLPKLAGVIQKNHNKIVIPVDMGYMDGGIPVAVTLQNGRVPEGFNHVLSGIGPQTDTLFASIISRADNPFKSANWTGPLVDSRKKALLSFMLETGKAISKIEKLATGGGDTEAALEALGIIPPFSSLAGGARQELVDGKNLAGIDGAINNSPKALKDKTFAPATAAEAHVLAHANVFGSLAKAMQQLGGKLNAETNIFIRGQAVGTIKITPTLMNNVLRLSMGSLADVYTDLALKGNGALEVREIDGQNPWIDFSITTLRTPTNDRRQINAEAVRQILSADPNVAVVLLQGEYNKKKGKYGTPGEIKTQSVEEKLNSVLVRAIREKGVDPASMPKASRPLPALAQVSESSIPGQLKIAVFVPTPNTDIYRLMQLAQDSGINLKELFEQSKDINDHKFVETMKALKAKPQIALLGQPLPVPPAPEAAPAPDKEEFAYQLEGLTFGGAKIDIKTQTIISKVSGNEAFEDILPILERVRQTKKLVRIMVPEASKAERLLKEQLRTFELAKAEQIKGLKFTAHSVKRGKDKFTAFIITPEIPYVIVGYGNEAIKVAPVLEASGFGTPAVAINSLSRIERVLHAFFMGYDVYHADQILVDKDTNLEVFLYAKEPQKLKEFEDKLFKALEKACIAKVRDELLSDLPLSEKGDSVKLRQLEEQVQEKGGAEAKERFARQYKGLLSVALDAGKFKAVVDATPEKIGAQNKRLFYEPAGKKYPDMVFVYQGGEEENVGESFSNVSADYLKLRLEKHIRHVSCNTTSLTTLIFSIIPYLEKSLAVDNLAIRRVSDVGDDKGGVAATQFQSGYHHWPDAVLTALGYILKTLEIPGMKGKNGEQLYFGNTDAAQTGGVTMYHHHVLSLVSQDGKPIDIKKIKEVLAARPDVALIDMPGGIFNGVRINELSHNLLPQAVREAPDGGNHILVPVVMVQETEDPTEAVLIIGVPQESVVARGQAHILHAAFGMASKDASTAVVNDATGATELVKAIETRLPADMTGTKAKEIEEQAQNLEVSASQFESKD